MDVFIQIVASGLTLGAMYAVATVGLSLVYGSLNMLNMAHGAILTLGGYLCYAGIQHLGLHPALALAGAAALCAVVGLLIYLGAALPLLRAEGFETNIFIATIGIGSILENLMLRGFGPYPIPQPLAVPGHVIIGNVHVPLQNLFILGVAVVLMAAVAFVLERTRTGRAIRATSMNREAAQLMGVAGGLVSLSMMPACNVQVGRGGAGGAPGPSSTASGEEGSRRGEAAGVADLLRQDSSTLRRRGRR
jgi:branched-subunit amino acid ABC-type transport system permease component